MAFPVVEEVATSSLGSSASQEVNLPANIAADDLLVMVFIWANGDFHQAVEVSGWTKLWGINRIHPHLGWAKKADGTEGSTVTVTNTNTAAGEMAAHVYRVTGWGGTLSSDLESVASDEGNTTNPNPPSLSPAWGAADTLWLAVATYDEDGSEDTVDAFPTNYTNGIDNSDGVNFQCHTASARREINTATEDPGAYTLSASQQSVAATVAIEPGSAGGSGTTEPITATLAGTSSDSGPITAQEAIGATLAGTSVDSVSTVILNVKGSATLAGTSLDSAVASQRESVTATLVGSSLDSAAVDTLVSLIATLAGTSTDSGVISTEDVASLVATLAGTSSDTATVSRLESLTATLAGVSADSGTISLERLVLLTATLAGVSTDTVGKVILNVRGTTTLAGTSLDSGTITASEIVAIAATLAGVSSDSGVISGVRAISATLIGESLDSGAISLSEALAATLAGTSVDSGSILSPSDVRVTQHFTDAAVTEDADARISQELLEILHDVETDETPLEARVSQYLAEALFDQPLDARPSQYILEVLRSVGIIVELTATLPGTSLDFAIISEALHCPGGIPVDYGDCPGGIDVPFTKASPTDPAYTESDDVIDPW